MRPGVVGRDRQLIGRLEQAGELEAVRGRARDVCVVAERLGGAQRAGSEAVEETDEIVAGAPKVGGGGDQAILQRMVLDAGVPAVRRFRLQRAIAVVAVQLIQGGRLESLSEARSQ